METILALLPKTIQLQLKGMSPDLFRKVEEVRIRIGRPIELIAEGGRPIFIPYLVRPEDGEMFLNELSQFSLYTMEEELKRGYITVSGGHRVGLAGKVILEEGRVKAVRHISSYNIRIARQKVGIAEPLVPYLYEEGWLQSLIIGAPQTGKTTILRDLARVVSTGAAEWDILPEKVGIVDERSEIAGCIHGVPQLDFGPRVDVLDSCPKAEGMMMMIRSMSPDVLIVDEIGRQEDSAAVMEAVNAGIKLMITAHGGTYEEICKRPVISELLSQSIFNRIIELRRDREGKRHWAILDSAGRKIEEKAVEGRHA
ncbi:stage III sporulation protein AA [Bacillus massiliglaciei]|uniref:stage III sporulation protein AA n=1 Tax=Bacillus massiliglaciei TaxID=1816693 RepID=UPI000A89796C|nr:stage III sporulation protein AA [Bacillus massiliglaciei]